MIRPKFQIAILVFVCHAVSSCARVVRPEGARLTGKSVTTIARQTAAADGIETRRFKNSRPTYLAASKTWYTCFEERWMLLAAGEQFTVFVDDPSGVARLHRNSGKRDALSRMRLDEELGRLAPEKGRNHP